MPPQVTLLFQSPLRVVYVKEKFEKYQKKKNHRLRKSAFPLHILHSFQISTQQGRPDILT